MLLSLTEVTVCTECGKAEFSVPVSGMKKFFQNKKGSPTDPRFFSFSAGSASIHDR